MIVKKDLIVKYILDETLKDKRFTFTISKIQPNVDVCPIHCRNLVTLLVDCGVFEVDHNEGAKVVYRIQPRFVTDILYDFMSHYSNDE